MTEDEFRRFLGKRGLSKEKIEELILRSSHIHCLQDAEKRGKHMTLERASALASLLRKTIVANFSTYDNGVFSKEDLLKYRIEKLPEDLPS